MPRRFFPLLLTFVFFAFGLYALPVPADEVVPIDENTRILGERYRRLGGPITLIVKPGAGHHPHSLRDPTPIVGFILKHTRLP